MYVLTHTIAAMALVTAIAVEGKCSARRSQWSHVRSCIPHMHNDQGVNGPEHVIAGTRIPEVWDTMRYDNTVYSRLQLVHTAICS